MPPQTPGTTNRIGPTIWSEFAAAGARTDGLSIGIVDGSVHVTDTQPGGAWTDAQKAVVANVIAAHDPKTDK